MWEKVVGRNGDAARAHVLANAGLLSIICWAWLAVGMAMVISQTTERGGALQFFFAWSAVGIVSNAMRGLHPLNLWWFHLASENRA